MPVPPVLVCVMSPFTESVLVPEFRISTYCSGKEFFAQSVSNGVAAPDTEVEKINKETTAHSIFDFGTPSWFPSVLKSRAAGKPPAAGSEQKCLRLEIKNLC